MQHIEIINCFINGASHEYFKANHQPMVDEDLSMAFDEAEMFAHAFPNCSSAQAHEAGHHYIQNGGNSYAHLPKEDCPLETRFERVGDAMAYLENEGLADTFNTTEGHAIACYQSNDEPGGNQNATIYEGCNGVQVEYHPELVARLRS